jgi:hypothetical protein
MDYIVIPTLGRIEKQHTYNNLPEQLKNITRFVVRDFEYDSFCQKYGEVKVIKLPTDIKNIAETRDYIKEYFTENRYWVFDDDLTFCTKTYVMVDGKPKWLSGIMTEQDFDVMIHWANETFDNGIPICGLDASSIIPSTKAWPQKSNSRILHNVCVNGPAIEDYNLVFDRTIASEDLDFLLQCLSYGLENRINTHLRVAGSIENSVGGCSVYRTLEVHNASNLKLSELWPGYVKTKISNNTSKLGKGEIVNLYIQWKKLLKDVQSGLYSNK